MLTHQAPCLSLPTPQQVLLKSVASMSNTFMHSWNNTEVTGSEHMEAALNRPKDQVGLMEPCPC